MDVVDLPERGDVGEVAVHKGLALLGGLLDAEGRGLAIAQQLRPVHVGTGSGVPPAPLRCAALLLAETPSRGCCWCLWLPVAPAHWLPVAPACPAARCLPHAPAGRWPPVPTSGGSSKLAGKLLLGDSAKKLHDNSWP